MGQETFRDNFGAVSYTNNDGTQNFSAGWQETNETTNPSAGQIRVVGNQLRFQQLTGQYILRDLDLTGASSATLTFTYDGSNIGDENLSLILRRNDGGLFILQNYGGGVGTASFTIPAAYRHANSAIGFYGIGWDAGETAFVDNVQISAVYPSPTITITDITVNEDAGSATFTVEHTGANTSGPFTVYYQTNNGTATGGGTDYTDNRGFVSFNGTVGDTETITVLITDDTLIEPSESFQVQFTYSPEEPGIDLSDIGTATIEDNDATIIADGATINTCSGSFFDSGGNFATYGPNEDITYTICPDSPGSEININFTFFDVESNFDSLRIYQGTSTTGTLIGTYDNTTPPTTTIKSSDASGCLTFRFVSNNSVQQNGWAAAISCTLSPAKLTVEDVTVDEDFGTLTFSVVHEGQPTSGPYSITYNTVDGTALSGSDYTGILGGTLNFDGTTGDVQTISVPINDDSLYESAESFSIELITTSEASVDISDTAAGTINDNEIVFENQPLTLIENFNGYLDYTSAGGSLRTADNATDPCAVTTTSSGVPTSGIPATGTVEKAFLYWSHSGYELDAQVTFEGNTVDADIMYNTTIDIGNGTILNFYGGVSDVSTIVKNITDPGTNSYDFSDLTIDTTANFCNTATVLGGWSLFIFYSDPNLPAATINLYQGFNGESNSSSSFTLSNFYAIAASGSQTSVLSWEGDQTLSNNELLSVTTGLGTFTLSGDGDNDGITVNNPFNSTIFDNTTTPAVNNSTSYGLDLDTYDFSPFVGSGETSVTTTVQSGQDFVILNALVLKVPSNLITGTVFEDVSYGGGSGRNQATASGVGLSDAVVELYDNTNSLQETTTTDASGVYSFGGMANGNYSVRVVNNTVRSSRGGGSTCTTCLPLQTFRTDYVLGAIAETTDEVGGADPSAEDTNAGSLVGAQTTGSVTIANEGVVGLDFGFNFNTIVNTNQNGQGSLEQFIVNTNNLDESGLDIEANSLFDPVAGEDTSIFMIPSTGDPLGRNADTNFSNGYFDIFIPNANTLSEIVDTNTIIDGRTQTAYSGDTNTGTIGASGSTVGISAIALPTFDSPEIQVHRNAGDVFRTNADNIVIRNLAIYANNNSGIRANGGSLTATANLIGVNAAGNNAGNIKDGIEIRGGAIIIDGNYIATNTDSGIWVQGGSATAIQNNHITTNGNAACDDNITIISGGGISIERNLIENASALGIDGDDIAGNVYIAENTITGAGQNGGLCAGNVENAGIKLDGNDSSIINNIIYSNAGTGVVLAGGSTSGNLISKNSFYANGTLGIDLDGFDALGDGVTLNELGDLDTGPNSLINFPIFSGAYIGGSNLVLEGWSRPGATIEVFLSDISEGSATSGDNQLGLLNDYGEGQTFIGSFIEGSAADLSTGTSNYIDDDNNSDNTNKFKFTIPLATGVAFGNTVTATATIANSTSEFSPVSMIKYYTVITNRRITYRVKKDLE